MLLKFVAIYALRMLYKPTAAPAPAAPATPTMPRNMIIPGFYDSPHPYLGARAVHKKWLLKRHSAKGGNVLDPYFSRLNI